MTSRTLTLVFTDLVSSTALKNARGDHAAGELVDRHRELVRKLAQDLGGRIVDWSGDGCFLTFDTPSAAVGFALGLQQAHGDERDLPRVRVGIHIGEVSEQADPTHVGRPDVEGLAVDLAARISGLADGDQILLSAAVHDSSRPRIGSDVADRPVRWQSHGSYVLKGFDKPVEIYEVGLEGLAPLRRPAAGEKATLVATGSAGTRRESWMGARGRRLVAAIIGGVAVVWFAVAVRNAHEPGGAAGGKPRPITSLAVLPFENYSGDPEQDYFVEGMTEALISELAKIRSIKVISRTTAMRYKGTEKPATQIARELGVEGLIEGSVYKGGEEVRITAQLIDGATDEHLWSASYTESLENVLKLQSKVALQIGREIRASVTPDEARRLAVARRTVPEAHAALLKAKHFYNRFTPESISVSERYYREALKHDPDFAPAYAGLSYMAWAQSTIGDARARPHLPEARALANEALRLDPGSADAHISLAWVSAVYEWNWERGEREFRRAIELDPSQALAYQGLADLLGHLNRPDEALTTAKAAIERDPLSPLTLWELAYIQFLNGSYEASIGTFERLFELEPDFEPACDAEVAYVLAGKPKDALRMAHEKLARGPSANRTACLAYVLAASGEREEAGHTLQEAIRRGEQEYVMPSVVAWTYVALGDPEAALRWIRKALDARDYNILLINVHPNLAALRSLPEFAGMVSEMGLRN